MYSSFCTYPWFPRLCTHMFICLYMHAPWNFKSVAMYVHIWTYIHVADIPTYVLTCVCMRVSAKWLETHDLDSVCRSENVAVSCLSGMPNMHLCVYNIIYMYVRGIDSQIATCQTDFLPAPSFHFLSGIIAYLHVVTLHNYMYVCGGKLHALTYVLSWLRLCDETHTYTTSHAYTISPMCDFMVSQCGISWLATQISSFPHGRYCKLAPFTFWSTIFMHT
jgi:hypothetical protein